MLRKTAAALLCLAMIIPAGCSSKKKDEETEAAVSDNSVTETSGQIDSSDYKLRFDTWSANRTAYMMSDDAVAESSSFSGDLDDDVSYESYLVSADNGNYRSIEVVIFYDTLVEEKHCEYYDVAPDLMYLVISNSTTNEDGSLSIEISKYAIVDSSVVYLVEESPDSATTYRELGEDEIPVSFKTFDEVLARYAG